MSIQTQKYHSVIFFQASTLFGVSGSLATENEKQNYRQTDRQTNILYICVSNAYIVYFTLYKKFPSKGGIKT